MSAQNDFPGYRSPTLEVLQRDAMESPVVLMDAAVVHIWSMSPK